MDEWDDPRLPFLWVVATADPQLLTTADTAHAHAVEEWEVSDFDRTVLDQYRTRMDPWHERHLWAVGAPVLELAAHGPRVEVRGSGGWDVPASGIRALRACGLPAPLFTRSFGRGADAVRPGAGFHALTGGAGSGGGFLVERGTGRVVTGPDEPEPLAASLVAFVEIAWRWHHLVRVVTEEGLDSGWDGHEDEFVEADFADLVRWIDPDSRFPEAFPVVDHL
jgi:hypothetical protein